MLGERLKLLSLAVEQAFLSSNFEHANELIVERGRVIDELGKTPPLTEGTKQELRSIEARLESVIQSKQKELSTFRSLSQQKARAAAQYLGEASPMRVNRLG